MTDPQPPVPPVPTPDAAAVPPVPPAPPVDDASAPPAAPAAAPTYPAYGQPAAVGYAPPTNTLAIVALVLGFLVPLGGIICGHIALGQIKRTGEGGHGLAMAGLILGYVFTALTLLFVIGYIVVIALAIGSTATYY